MDKREVFIREARPDDLNAITKLYDRYMYDSELAALGGTFIKNYLGLIIRREDSLAFVIDDNGHVAGFIMATLNGRDLRFTLVKEPGILYAWLRSLLKRPGRTLKTLGLTAYPGRSQVEGVAAELLFISILPEYRKMGFAKRLIEKCLGEMKRRGVEKVKVTVVSANERVRGILKDMGFSNVRDFNVLNKWMSLYARTL